MPHAKLEDYKASGSEEGDFKSFHHNGIYGHVTWNIYLNFTHLSHRGSRLNLALIGLEVSEKMFENNVYIHEHGPRAVAKSLLASKFYININYKGHPPPCTNLLPRFRCNP